MGLFVLVDSLVGFGQETQPGGRMFPNANHQVAEQKQELKVTSLVRAVLAWRSLARDQELSPYPPLFN